ncbi:DUF4342 domain-containing protein [Ornithinimicrobium faecis]|uniref:DUF4342 domain-containing protein n=1 Tax=Ornithinimicrobium faecis TaxID=2934158 RepID=A0ABY4YTZ0_9MICO|nr:DUF4342 domain-containing protein [Ornithinimicrobium sp. HY1793]USQ79935.1 DUF4342 domain-containing protein [Ornithinimicrobium sp. HY1793]
MTENTSGADGAADTGGRRSTYEEFTVPGSELLEQMKRLLAEGNVRRVYLKKDGTTLLEVPLTAGVAVTAVTAVFAPVLVAVGAIAAMVTQVTIGVERQRPAGDDSDTNAGDGGGDGATALSEGPSDT